MNFFSALLTCGGKRAAGRAEVYRSTTGTCSSRRPGRFWRNFSTFHIWVVFNYIWNRVYAFIPSRTAGGVCQRIHGKSEMVRGRRSGALRDLTFSILLFSRKSSSSLSLLLLLLLLVFPKSAFGVSSESGTDRTA